MYVLKHLNKDKQWQSKKFLRQTLQMETEFTNELEFLKSSYDEKEFKSFICSMSILITAKKPISIFKRIRGFPHI